MLSKEEEEKRIVGLMDLYRFKYGMNYNQSIARIIEIYPKLDRATIDEMLQEAGYIEGKS
jgi:hypothetical protein